LFQLDLLFKKFQPQPSDLGKQGLISTETHREVSGGISNGTMVTTQRYWTRRYKKHMIVFKQKQSKIQLQIHKTNMTLSRNKVKYNSKYTRLI